MHGGGGHASGAIRGPRNKEKAPSKKELEQALAAEAPTETPATLPAASAKTESDEEPYEEGQHGKIPIAQRRAEREERLHEDEEGHLRKGHRSSRSASEGDAEDEEDEEAGRGVTPFAYTHPKLAAVTDALFMWERVAAFSQPTQVAELERVSRDVHAALKVSNKGNRLMQRYWNAQWCRMVWKDEEMPPEKRTLHAKMFTHADAKRRWKKVFVEEYPFYLDRTFQNRGGRRNNDTNEAKVLFHIEVLNPNRTAAELQKMELTEEEALLKEQRKRGVEVEFEHQEEHDAGASGEGGVGGVVPRLNETKKDHQAKEKGRPRAVQKESYTRADYKEDFRTGARKGKHQKGGTNRWENYDSYGDYDY